MPTSRLRIRDVAAYSSDSSTTRQLVHRPRDRDEIERVRRILLESYTDARGLSDHV